jgi:uncharacterized repeat protein (TIGR02543 family)
VNPFFISSAITIFALATSLLGAELSVHQGRGKNTSIVTSKTPEGLSDSDWSGIRGAYEKNRHAVVANPDGTHQARNPGQAWLTKFDGHGFTVTPDAGGWTWGLELMGFGEAVEVRQEGEKISYAKADGLTEWFINDTRGLEQGWTLTKRPERAGASGPVRLDLRVRGGLRPQVSPEGASVAFMNESGSAALTYGGLKAWDAYGKPVEVRFVEPGSDSLCVMFEDEDAKYPITVDPIAQQAYLKASNTEASDLFGWSVAISGDTVVVGATGEDSSATGVNGNQSNNSASSSGAAYVFTRSGTTWSQQAYLKASNTEAYDGFGWSVAVSGDTLVVGALNEASSATGVNGNQANNSALYSGAAYVFTRSGTTWSQQAYLKASNTEYFDQFGSSVAVSGDTVVVGAPEEDSSFNWGPDSGAAYVFTRSGTTWSQEAYLKASNTGSGELFGCSVAVSGDTVVVGAAGESSSATGSGAAYVFVRSETNWWEQAYLKASNPGNRNYFGGSVAISGDTVVVGAAGESSSATGVDGNQADNLAPDSGAVYVFIRSGNTWSQQAYLKASNPGNYNYFGGSVAISGDTVGVGAPYSGAAYVFTRSGTTWSQQAYLKASNTAYPFGNSVAVSGDTVVVGAYGESSSATGVNGNQTDNSAPDSGAVYAFTNLDEYYSLLTSAVNGTVTGAGVYIPGSSAILTAKAAPGYAFTGWTGDASGTTNPLSVLMDSDKTVGTSFTRQYTLTTSTLSNGTITGIFSDGKYLTGTTATLTAVPATGYGFTGWTGSASGTANPLSLLMNSDKTIGATFPRIPPTISAIAGVTIAEDGSTGPMACTISDLITPASSLSVSGGSSNTGLVLNGNIVFGGSGGSRTVSVTPLANQTGSSLITVTVSNGEATASETFLLTVTAVNDAPTISAVANRVINEDTSTGSLAFTVGDVETAAGSLVVTALSSNTTLVHHANILLAGTGSQRTVTVTPAPNQYGSSIITLSVSDGNASTSTSFVITVNPLNDAPTISAIADQSINSGTSTGAIGFTVGDLESAAGDLTVTASSSNTVLVPNSGVVIAGSSASRTVAVTPVATQTGTAVITISVSDGSLTSSESFVLTVQETPFGQDFVWAKGFGGSNSDTAYGIATDSAGNAMVAVDFTGTVPFGTFSLTAAGSSSDLALLKVAADGSVLAATRFGGSNFDYSKAVAVDTANNVILAGEFLTSTLIGGVTHTSAGSKDISLLKVNSTGTLLWSKRFGGTLSDSIYGLATDADGNILLAGDFSGSITFGATTLISSGNRDGFVAKLDPSGTPLWAMKVGGTGNDTAFAVTVSPSGQILVGGSFSLVSTFGTLSRTSAGGTDGFAMAVSPAGIVQWATRFGGSANDSARAVTVDVTGAACFAGNFAGTDASFGMEILASEGADDVFVTRLNASDGSILNVKQCGGAGADAGLGLAADPFGSLYLSGSYSGTAYFDGHTLITPQGPDAFVAKLSVDGNFLWALAGGGVANDSATSIAVDRAGHVAVAGLFAQSAQIGSHEVTAGGLVDLFVARINGPVPSFVTTLGSVMADIGDTFSISAPAVGADPLAYQWFKGTVPLAGQTSSTLEIPTATIGDQGSYHVVATNFYGSTQLPPVTVTVRVPDRVISIDAPVASQENRTLEVPVYLDSDGDVTGLTVVLPYDRDLLRNPSFLLGPHLVAGNSSVLVDTNAGTIRVVGSAFPSTIPVGRQLVGTFRFTTRSVPDNGIAVFSPTLSSISDQFGAALGGYTKLVGDQTPIAQRDIPGDANNNGRLDVSDAAELIRLYANPAQIRTWDHYLNDLNLDTILTEGDATRVLRVVANLDETPSFPEAIAPMMAPMMMAMASPSSLSTVSSSSLKGASVKMTSTMSMNSFSLAPAAARLVLTRLTGANANKVLAQVYLDNVPAGQAGVSFQVDYPASVLRVAEASSLIIPSGGLPTGVAPTWNVSPGNAYAAQTGSLTLAAAWDSSWTFANGQAVANIVFEVNPAATGQVHFPLTLAATEVAPYNADGPSTPLSVPGHVVVFNRTYADWALATLGNAAAGSSLDPDGDGMSNALEYAASTNPNDPNSRLQTTSAAMTVNGYRLRWFAAYGVSYKVRWSADLTNWNDLTTPYTGTGAETEVTDPAPPTGKRFYRVEVISSP